MRRVLPGLLAWWVVLFGLWCTFVGNLTSVELGCGVAAALIATLGLAHLRWLDWPVARPRVRWLLWLPVVLASTVADTARLLRALGPTARRSPGRFRTVDLGPPADTADGYSHRAYAAVALSAAPGSYVIDVYPEHGQARVHTLVDGAPDLARAVQS
ncbi:MAG TPA: Na+/H+ antiporter subunit E [Mycobacteriales bacterium]|nr:Na+/H+ antiporter subunit E [Mycobacteriales bacterium]